jgi:tetratricopeptide (TPR) repeat protein
VQTKKFDLAKSLLHKAIQIQPNYAKAHNNLGVVLKKLGEHQKAISSFEKTIQIQPNYAMAHNNLGIVLQELGEHQKAISSFEKAIQIQPNFAKVYHNLGMVYGELGELQKGKSCYEKSIQINPSNPDSYWNLHSHALDIDEALNILIKLNDIDNTFIRAKIMISALKGFKGKFEDFDTLIRSSESNHPMTRSIKWVFSLPKIPKIFFNRWNFFDVIVAQTDKSRPFYEFGVWNGISFKYLIKTFKKGFGFDTFTGLPEDWHSELSGTYSSLGSIPKIKGGEFIVGKFENTLPKFFSQKRPTASLINFDADLYTSTLCALNYSNKVIDEKSILIFDEFLTNKNWEKDEYKALNEFCNNLGIGYEVLAVSFFSKQVAIKLKKN